jgi:thiamine biosynthesis lipoprotein
MSIRPRRPACSDSIRTENVARNRSDSCRIATPNAFLKESENVSADQIDEMVEPLCVETRGNHFLAVHFTVLATACEILLASADLFTALELGALAAEEARRVERMFSHHRNDGVSHWIDDHRGFGMDAERILALTRQETLNGYSPRLSFRAGGELDFGGIGKEYAVDRVYDLLLAHRSAPFLIDFGGVLRANCAPEDGSWRVDIGRPGSEKQASLTLDVDRGALVTSGGTRQYLSKGGLHHSANPPPRTVWPTRNGPRSVTVAANSCTKAGLLATLAMLHGERAEEFLEKQGVRHWVLP